MLFANAGRWQYSVSDVPNFLRARTLAAKADASIDQIKFHEVVARHRFEGYDSYKYFDKQLWLRSKMMRAIELGLDKAAPVAVLDLGCGAGYFLYCCKFLGHDVHGIDLPEYAFYRDMIALFGLSRRASESRRTNPCRGSTGDLTSLPPTRFASMDTRPGICGESRSGNFS